MYLLTTWITGDYLFQTPFTAPPVIYGVVTAVFGVLFVGSALFYWRRAKIAPENAVLRRLIRRMSKAGMWISAIGLFLALMRYLEVLYFSMPILLYLLLAAMVLTVGYFIYDVSENYPQAVWRLQESHVERRYRPPPRRRAEPQPARPKVRGKRRR